MMNNNNNNNNKNNDNIITDEDEAKLATPDALKVTGIRDDKVLMPVDSQMLIMEYFQIVSLPVDLYHHKCIVYSFANPTKFIEAPLHNLYLPRCVYYANEAIERYTQVYGYNWDADVKDGEKSVPKLHRGILMRKCDVK